MGIIEDRITPLSQAELNILNIESNVGVSGTYYIHLEGTVSRGLDRLYKVLETLEKGIKLNMPLSIPK